MHTDNHMPQSHMLKRYVRFVVVFLASLAVIASAQAPKNVPAMPAHATLGNANLASQSDVNSSSANPTTAKPVIQGARNPTLQELYAMFFEYAAHIEARSDADEKAGYDRTDYRHHLRRASQLTDGEYAIVLAAAQRFAAIDADVQTQLTRDIEAGSASKEQTTSLFARRDSSLNAEIANVRQLLGEKRADIFDAYLQNEYIPRGTHPAPPAAPVSSPRSPSSSSSFTLPASSLDTGSQTAIPTQITTASTLQSANSAKITAASTQVTAQAVNIIGAQVCGTYSTSEYSGSFEICADSQLSYTGSGTVEPYAHLVASWNNIGFDPNNSLGYLLIQGYFSVNQVFNDNLGCHAYWTQNIPNTACQHSPDVPLSPGNLYQWYGVTSMGAYDLSCVVPSQCFETQESVQSGTAEVQIYSPNINSISPNSFNPGATGTFVISGTSLISPFQNPPSVGVNASNLGSFSVQSYDYNAGTITVSYSILSSAPPSTYAVTVNNGFGTGTGNIKVNAQPPTITNITVNGVASAPLQAGTVQTITLTGTNFGTSDQVNVSTDAQFVSVVVGSVGTPVKSGNTMTLTFQVATAVGASAGSTNFVLQTNDGASNPNVASPYLAVDPIVLPPPQIMRVTSTVPSNLQNCTGGTEIDGQTTQVYAGQLLLLCSPQSNLPAGVTVTYSSWSAQNPADLTGGYCAPGAFATCGTAGQELPNPPMSNTSSIAFYWVNPDSTESMTYKYCVNNSTSQCTSVTANFDISGPTQAPASKGMIWSITLLVGVSGPPDLAFGSYNANGVAGCIESQPGAGCPRQAGITFFNGAAAPTGNAGTFEWVQTVNYDQQQQLNVENGIQVCVSATRAAPINDAQGNPELDNWYPYPSKPDVQSAFDAPASQLVPQNTEQQRAFSATMYLMWDPTLNVDGSSCTAASDVSGTNGKHNTVTASTCAGSIPVPLASLNWEYAGCAVNTYNPQIGVNGWSADPGYGCGLWTPSPSAGPSSTYPQWNYAVSNGLVVCH